MSAARVGYKQTEVGVIPEDWGVTTLAQAGEFLNRQRKPVKDSDRAKMRGDIPYYGAAGIVDHVNDFLFDDDLVLIGEDGENILSRNLPVAFRISGKAWVNNHAHVLKARPHVDTCFLATSCAELDLAAHNSGTAQPKITKATCERLTIPLPPLPEQRAIAEALGDADGLIAALEALIAKKRAIKQGAMQDLLTGHRRLPGFEGEWRREALGTIADISRGASPRPIENPIWFDDQSSIGWVRISDVSRSGMTLLETEQKLSRAGIERSRFVPAGGLIMSIAATVGRPIITSIDVCIHDGFVVFANLRYDLKYTYYLLRLIEKDWGSEGQTGSQMNLNTQIIFKKIVAVAPTLDEQRAIAVVLSDMDEEIAALEGKLAKARAVKQGMMQVLLTGEIRLT